MHSISMLFWTSGIYIHFKEVKIFATMVFIHYDEKLKTSLYLHTKFETSKKKTLRDISQTSKKVSRQALRIRKICHEEQHFISNCKTLMDIF